MRTIQAVIDIDAPAAAVWAVLTRFDDHPAWNPFIPEAAGEVREGATLTVRIEPPGGRAMTFRPVVTRVEPERVLQWQGRLFVPGLFDGEHSFELVPSGDGGVRFFHRERFTGLLVPLFWKSLDVHTRAGFDAMNTALKQRAEAGHRYQS